MKIVTEMWSKVLEVATTEIDSDFLEMVNEEVFIDYSDKRDKPVIEAEDVASVINKDSNKKLEVKYLFGTSNEQRAYSLYTLVEDIIDEYFENTVNLDSIVCVREYEEINSTIEE